MDYSKCVIYKLVGECGGVYVGHTIDPINRGYRHTYIEKVKNPVMTEIEKYPCSGEAEARMREQHWIDIIKPTANQIRAFRTPEQKAQQNLKYCKEQRDERRPAYLNKLARAKEKVTCDKCGATLNRGCMWKHQKRDVCKKETAD